MSNFNFDLFKYKRQSEFKVTATKCGFFLLLENQSHFFMVNN